MQKGQNLTQGDLGSSMEFKTNFKPTEANKHKCESKQTQKNHHKGDKHRVWYLPHRLLLPSVFSNAAFSQKLGGHSSPFLPEPTHSDPVCSSCRKQWEDPFEFRPERFLTEDSTAINKTLSEKVMIFGLGKRRCIGETPAKWEFFLFLSILLQQLEFSVPPGLKVDLTPTYGLIMKPPICKHLQALPRFSK